MFSLLDQNNNADDYFQVSFPPTPDEAGKKYAGGAVIEKEPTMKPVAPTATPVRSTTPMVSTTKPVRCSRPAMAVKKIKYGDLHSRNKKNHCKVEYSIMWTAVVLLLLFAAQPVNQTTKR